MRKKITIILALVFVLVAGSAVTSYSLPISFGIKGGMGLSNTYGSNAYEDRSPILTGGLMLSFDIHFLSWLTCEINLGWRTRGTSHDYPDPATDAKVVAHYFDMDFLAKIYLTPRKPAGFFILIGGYVGGPMKDSSDASGDPIIVGVATNTSDVGMTFGGGVNIGLSRGMSLTLETYGLIGFKRIGSSRDRGDSGTPRWIAGYVMAGIMFDF